jgi:hypothetical protein
MGKEGGWWKWERRVVEMGKEGGGDGKGDGKGGWVVEMGKEGGGDGKGGWWRWERRVVEMGKEGMGHPGWSGNGILEWMCMRVGGGIEYCVLMCSSEQTFGFAGVL